MSKDDYRLAPKMPTPTPMPKCKPPKDYWEIPSFMESHKNSRSNPCRLDIKQSKTT